MMIYATLTVFIIFGIADYSKLNRISGENVFLHVTLNDIT